MIEHIKKINTLFTCNFFLYWIPNNHYKDLVNDLVNDPVYDPVYDPVKTLSLLQKELKYIERIGSDKAGYWKVKK